ncbi:hypothetical protein K440DRAFT_90192 [Wilcoxina mikolae CBS 423.85]|nr:hypothetical protein K440DRAFT_90192 [Wilcoxina mikolae CBS 423.85]
MPQADITSSPESPMFGKVTPPTIPQRPNPRPRSAEPVLRSNTPPNPISPFAAQQPPTPPETAHTESIREDNEICQQDIILPPSRPPPAPPTLPAFAPFTTGQMISSKTTDQMRRGSSSFKAPPNVPMQRFYTETAPPSTMSALLLQQQQHRDPDGVRTVAEHPVANMPPSPPLTRRSTNSVRSSGSKYPPLQGSSPPPAAPSEVGLQVRPSTASGSSNVSLKDVRKVGKHLGQTPIDYLIPNGSLPAAVSGYFHPTHDPCNLEAPPSMRGDNPDANPVAGIFGNLNFLLDSYLAILSSGGSIAVGTGYHSVARRLLERMETLFARNLGVDGVGWAEVLEYLRGSRPKPFLCVLPVRGILARKEEAETPVGGQDQACRTRELAESVVAGVKVKPAMTKVEQWLEEVEQVLKATGPDDCCGPSADKAEDQCLAKQNEDEEDRMVCEIIEGILKNNTEENQIKNFRRFLEDKALVTKMKLALTRLYHDHPPESITPPIVALYMLLHPELHPVLRALANVTEPELELINSGRFDAFLDGSSNVVARDEEEELNVITSLDRRLWTVLEGLEDEIEELHTRALVVRRALKSRKECISRKRPSSSPRSASPVQVKDEQEKRRLDEEQDWAPNVPTLHLPITPDDSASNITFNRRRRQERASKLDKDEDEKKRKKGKKEKKKADEQKFSLKEFAIKSGEFGPSTAVEDAAEKSDGGDTMVSAKRRRKKEGHHSERKEKNRCAECGSCVTAKEGKEKKEKEDKKDREERKKERKEKKEERAERDEKEKEKEKEKDKDKDKDKDKERERRKDAKDANARLGESDSLKSRSRPN